LTDSSSGVAGGGGDDMDGVYLFKPHSGAINSLQWNQSGSKLLSQSYDGTIRLMDVERQVFVDAFAAYDDSEEFKGKIGYGMDEGNKYYTQFACYDDRNEDCIFLSTSLGGVVHLDLRSKGSVTFNVVLSDKKINSLR
jgi:WD40 repeat protein